MNNDNGLIEPNELGLKNESARVFEDIFAWQKARHLTKRIYELTRSDRFSRDFGLASQTQRAAVSVMANIAEGYDRRGSVEFAHFLGYAKGSCGELRSNLYVALDIGYLTADEFSEIRTLSDEVSFLIQRLITSLRKPRVNSKNEKWLASTGSPSPARSAHPPARSAPRPAQSASRPTRSVPATARSASRIWVQIPNQHLHGCPQIFVLVHHFGDFCVSVHHRRVVAIAEEAADMLPRVAGDLAGNKYRDVASVDNRSLARRASNFVG
jgi:four helix bundle protein